jgi:DNA-binding MarR family transcriptional regulator
VIGLNGGHQVGEVANVLGVSPPAATKSIDKLEGLGLIVRSPLKGDRRATLLSLSAKGRRLVQKYEDVKAGRLSSVLQAFTREELDRLAELLERFSLRLIKQEDSDSGLCLLCAAYCEDDCPVSQVRGDCPYQLARGDRARKRDVGAVS